MKNIIYLSLLLLAAVACEKESLDSGASQLDLPVVEAYLVTGQMIRIKVSRQVPFEQLDTTLLPVKNLNLILSTNGEDHLLVEIAEGLYGDSTLIVQAEQNYRLFFEYHGKSITAETTTPKVPIDFKTSTQSLTFDTNSFPPSLPDPIELTWRNPENNYYQVKIENIESNPRELSFGRASGGERPRFTTIPEQISTYELRPNQFQFVGTHRIVLFEVAAEYVTLAQETSNASEQNLTTPYTNIIGGTGIFTGTGADTLFIEIRD